MDAQVQRAALRFIQSLDRGVDAESFSEADAWAFMQDLVYEFAMPGRSLHPAQVAALRDFGHTAGIKPGAPVSSYQPGLEAALGPTDLSAQDLDTLVRWAHSQVNARFEEATAGPVKLNAEPTGPVGPPRKPLW